MNSKQIELLVMNLRHAQSVNQTNSKIANRNDGNVRNNNRSMQDGCKAIEGYLSTVVEFLETFGAEE